MYQVFSFSGSLCRRPRFFAPCLLFLVAALCPLAALADAPANELFELVNEARAQEGRAPLQWDERLAKAAQKHAQLMAKRLTVSHQLDGEAAPRERLAAVPLKHSGENVGMAGSILQAHIGLMHSPHHRENIMDPVFDSIGVGVAQSGNELFVVEDFAQRMEQVSGRDAGEEVAEAFAQQAQWLTGMATARMSKLACDMAHHRRLDTAEALNLPNAFTAAAYTSDDPGKLPADSKKFRTMREASRFEAGACFARTPEYPSGIYWVLLVLFHE